MASETWTEMLPTNTSAAWQEAVCSANDTDTSRCQTALRRDTASLMRTLYLYSIPPLLLFCAATCVVNAIVVVSVRWIRRPLSPTLSFSVSLAAADAYTSLVVGMGLVLNSLLPVGLEVSLGRNEACYALTLEAFRLGGIIVTVAHLTALAINHYIGILRPLHYASTIMTPRTIVVCIVLLWVLPILFFFAYFSVVDGQGFRSKLCQEYMFLTYRKFRLMFSVLFFCPLLVMAVIYIHIFIIVRKHQARRMQFHHNNNNSQQLARSVKAIKTTVLILGTYIVGWMPAVLLYCLVCSDCTYPFTAADPVTMFCFYTACNTLIVLKTFVDPVIYAARMHEIKMALRRMKSHCCSNADQMRVNSERGRASMTYQSRQRSFNNDTCSLTRYQSARNSPNGSIHSNTNCVTMMMVTVRSDNVGPRLASATMCHSRASPQRELPLQQRSTLL